MPVILPLVAASGTIAGCFTSFTAIDGLVVGGVFVSCTFYA